MGLVDSFFKISLHSHTTFNYGFTLSREPFAALKALCPEPGHAGPRVLAKCLQTAHEQGCPSLNLRISLPTSRPRCCDAAPNTVAVSLARDSDASPRFQGPCLIPRFAEASISPPE